MYKPMDDKLFLEKFDLLYERVRLHMMSAPGCHDFDHVLRVLHNARLILKEEKGADRNIVEFGALLHDIARPEELEAKGTICHAECGAKLCVSMLVECGVSDPALTEKISSTVLRHRYRGGNQPVSLEDKIVYDADKLDSIGCVGIGRAFHFAGRIGARLHNTAEEAVSSKAYSQEDSAYREYLVKLKHVPEKMLTASGRVLAEKREVRMKVFFDTLNKEIYDKQ